MPTESISPPYEELHSLVQPLTKGEWKFLEWLRKNLTAEWEIYVQPYLNGLRPDFVLLSPKNGIAVYEVKDWNLSAIRYQYTGVPPKLFGDDGSKHFAISSSQDPVAKIQTYKSEIFDLYCPSLGRKHGFGAIVGGVVFPFSTTEQTAELLAPALLHSGLLNYPRHNVVVGSDLLSEFPSERDLKRVLPSIFLRNQEMSADVADDLRHWLVEPEPPRDQRRNAFNDLDDKQQKLVTTRNKSGGIRVRGPAGSGKTLVLCGKTARLVGEGKRVLLVTFNVTLLNYLRDTIARFFAGVDTSRRWVSKQYEIMNFHHFCSRLASTTGHADEYRQIWRDAYGGASEDGEELPSNVLENVLSTTLPAHALQWAEELPDEEKFDAVLVDEAQDLWPQWWLVLERCRRDGGEVMVAADSTQNVYSVDQAWIKGPLRGFSGKWGELSVSYRLPPEVASEASRFIDRYLPEAETAKPIPQHKTNGELFLPEQQEKLAHLRWINVAQDTEKKVSACLSAMQLMLKDSESTSSPLNYADLTFLVESEDIGVALRRALSSLGIRVIDTFDADSRQARRKKMAFRKGDGRVKITTVFSYKGWETRALILQVGQARSERDHALFYTGFTRLKVSRPKSYLTVVNSAPEYRSWGETWSRI